MRTQIHLGPLYPQSVFKNAARANERQWGYNVQGYLTRKRTPLGPYRRPMPRVLGESKGGGRFLMSEVHL